MKSAVGVVSSAVLASGIAGAQPAADQPMRPPSVPLVACDPYFSIWSPADRLNDVDTTHWTGKPHRLSSSATIDGKSYRVIGGAGVAGAAMTQKSLAVLPTRTIYAFEEAGVALTLTFLTAALPDDIDILSRPVTYLTYEFSATDGKQHDVAFSFDAGGELAVNVREQEVTCATEKAGGLTALRIGSKEQNVLGKAGDDIRIDWGFLYVAAPVADVASAQIVDVVGLRSNGAMTEIKAPAPGGSVAAVLTFKVGKVSREPVSRWLMLAYDDLYSIQYLGKNLRPYWRRNGWEAADLLKASANDYEALVPRCAEFDKELMADLEAAGGLKYAKICALAYRQCFAAGKFVVDE